MEIFDHRNWFDIKIILFFSKIIKLYENISLRPTHETIGILMLTLFPE